MYMCVDFKLKLVLVFSEHLNGRVLLQNLDRVIPVNMVLNKVFFPSILYPGSQVSTYLSKIALAQMYCTYYNFI